MNPNQKRYQECSKLEKFWRWRWYLALPFICFFAWLTRNENFSECYDLAIARIEFKMNWYFTLEEVKEVLEKNNIEWNKRQKKIFSTKNKE